MSPHHFDINPERFAPDSRRCSNIDRPTTRTGDREFSSDARVLAGQPLRAVRGAQGGGYLLLMGCALRFEFEPHK